MRERKTINTCQGPDPNTKKPKTAIPPKACDAHCHVFGPRADFPFHPKRSYTPPDAGKEQLRKLHQVLGFERAVIVQATCHGDDNSAMLDAIASSDGSYRGVAMVEETITEKELEKLHIGGVRGTRFSFARHLSGPPNFKHVRRVTEKYSALGWHAVLYLESEDIVEYVDELTTLPVPVVIDHMARFNVLDGLKQKAFKLILDFVRNDNFWIKISGAERLSNTSYPFDDIVPFAQALIEAAPDRIIWGTDWPHPNINGQMPNDGELVDMLEAYAPDKNTREKIIVDNPSELYGFDKS